MEWKEFYAIEWENGHSLLVIRMRGFWTDAVMNAYLETTKTVFQSIMRPSALVGALVDAATLPVQTSTIAERHQAMFTDFAGKIDHVAVVINSALVRLQSRRMPSSGTFALCNDEEEARKWLAGRLKLPAIASF